MNKRDKHFLGVIKSDLRFLRMAVQSEDPKKEILMRIEDIERLIDEINMKGKKS